MKKVFILFLGVSLFLTGCNKDDEGEKVFGFIEVGDDMADLQYGRAIDYGNSFGDGESFNIDVSFFNHDVSGAGVPSDVPDDIIGLIIEAYSSVENRLAPGKYLFSDSGSEFTFYSASIAYKTIDVYIESGTLEVISSGTDSYDLTFVGVDENGNDVNLEFDGTVDYEVESSLGLKNSIK